MSALPQIVLAPPIVPLSRPTVGAVVIGGDYQGLGIVRSLGRHGIPVCVVDDEHSISRYSRYAKKFVSVSELHDARKTVDSLLAIGKRLGLQGWVLYPTREELVAAILKKVTGRGEGEAAPDGAAINARHQECLKRAASALTTAIALLESGEPPELVSVELRASLSAVGEIVGEAGTEEILGKIFSSFCIGK